VDLLYSLLYKNLQLTEVTCHVSGVWLFQLSDVSQRKYRWNSRLVRHSHSAFVDLTRQYFILVSIALIALLLLVLLLMFCCCMLRLNYLRLSKPTFLYRLFHSLVTTSHPHHNMTHITLWKTRRRVTERHLLYDAVLPATRHRWTNYTDHFLIEMRMLPKKSAGMKQQQRLHGVNDCCVSTFH